MKNLYRTGLLIISLVFSPASFAASITYAIDTQAVIEERNGVAASGSEHMFLSTDVMAATFTYNDTAIGIETGNHTGTLYNNISDFRVSIAGFDFTDTSGFTTVSNDRWTLGVVDPVDALFINAHQPPTVPAGYPQFADGDGTVFTLRDMRIFWGEQFSGTDFLSDELLPSALPVAGSGNSRVTLVFATYDTDGTTVLDQHVVHGGFSAVSVIPIPAAVWMFISALGVLGLKRRFLM